VSETFLLHRLGQFLRGHSRLERSLHRLLRPVERVLKGLAFDCQMCGQCVLHSTGMVCPMTCPKDLRNGPCGGVRLNGACEVYPEMECVWVVGYRRAMQLPWPEEFHDLRPPVDWTLQGSSSWINLLTGRDRVLSGCASHPASALEVVTHDGK
jgi:hypothetical protein